MSASGRRCATGLGGPLSWWPYDKDNIKQGKWGDTFYFEGKDE